MNRSDFVSSDLARSQHPGPALGAADRFARGLVTRLLDRLDWGRVELVDADGARAFGPGGEDAPHARVLLRAPRAYRRIAFGGSIGAAEAYMDGDWDASDLPGLFRMFARAASVFDAMDRGAGRFGERIARAYHVLRRNTREGSRRNIAAHYDLGNDFFELFLDETMTYSCGVFERPEASMAEASRAKIDRLCRKLRLGPGDHLLEIGTGWGAFAIHAARKYGCRVTTTTISREQHAWAARKVREAGLEDRVTLLLSDYRDLTGTYDKLVSVEMIEAVGAAYVPGFLAKCASLLRPEGLMALQAITVREQSYAAHLGTVDFIKRYIFPGGELVGLGALCDAVGRATDLRVEHVEDLSPHYAETLRRWRERFEKHRAAIADLGYPERFLRMWEYYLTYCEGGFAERYVGGAQIVLAKPLARPASLLGPIAEGAV